MTVFRVYFGVRSPYSRLGLHVVERAGLRPQLIPFTGPPDGVAFFNPTDSPPKLAYYAMDAPRMTMRMGLAIRMPDPFEVDFAPVNRAAILAEEECRGLAFALAASDARWGAGENVSDISVLKNCAAKAGWREDGPEEAQASDIVKARAREHRALIEKDAVFGVPFAVYGDQKYWGHERFALLVEAAGEP